MQHYLKPLCCGSIMGGLLTLGLTCAMLANSTAAALAAAEQHWVLRVNGQVVAAADEEKELAEMVDAVKASYCNGNTDSCEVLSDLESEQVSGSLDATVPTGAAAEQAVANALRVRTSSTVVEQQVIEAQTVTVEDNTMYTDQTVTEEGWDGELEITTEISAVNGKTVVAKQISSVVTTDAQDTIIRVGTKTRPEYIWPCGSRKITSYFGNRSSPTAGASTYHKGIDISASHGSAIYAAASGTVTTATYSDSAGNYITISHGNGTSTSYMHCSALYVSVGDRVSQGQTIAAVGSTGFSTGPHLHFAVIVNGDYKNPLNYVG